MRRLIELAIGRPRVITVAMLSIVILGSLALAMIPMDILPVYNQPAVQTLTFYSGMPAETMSQSITNRMERWTGQAAGMLKQESRSIIGASIIRNYFRSGVDPNGAITQVNSLALAEVPNLPPGTLPPIVLPYDPTGTVPACLIAVDSATADEAVLYDVARYEARNLIMSQPGANAPVVYGGMVRAVLAEVDPVKLQARNLSLRDVLLAIEQYNLFLPTGDAKFGVRDYAIDSNSMFKNPADMVDIPLRIGPDRVDFLGDVATPKDAHLIQMNAVRVNGRREVYIPVFRQHGASTLQVVDDLRSALPAIQSQLSRPDVDLKLVMDQSVYVSQAIRSLAVEGLLGAVLCALVILVFLGLWRMTVIAALLIPLAILAALAALDALGNTVNVMTLAGMALAVGPLVDLAIVVLENTHRHLEGGEAPAAAARDGAGEVVMPVTVATFSTLLVLAPLAFMPGTGQFLFRPLALTVALAMIAGLVLAITLVPSRSAQWLKPHDGNHPHGGFARVSGHIQRGIDAGIRWYTRRLEGVLRRRILTLAVAAGLLILAIFCTPLLRREFFPESDSGAFDIYVRADTGTRLEETEKRVAEVEQFIHDRLGGDVQLVLSEIGVQADWSAAYTENCGPMDCVIKVQLQPNRTRTAQECARLLRHGLASDPHFATLDVAFNTGGAIRGALNLGRPTPINIQIQGKNTAVSHQLAEAMGKEIAAIPGVVDARIMQRLDYPGYVVEVDRAKARDIGLTQREIMENVVAALQSSIQFNKKNFWIDPRAHNQYYVGVQYPEKDIVSLKTVLNVSITSKIQKKAIPLSNLVKLRPTTLAAEVDHSDLQTTIDLNMNVEGRDLGHVADDIGTVLDRFGKRSDRSTWTPYDPNASGQVPLAGAKVVVSGEYGHMQHTFRSFAIGLGLAVVFIYFLMVVLLDSYLIPVVILAAVPVGLVGVVPMLAITGTAINVQSLLGVIFVVGIIVSNAVLLVDFAQKIRVEKGVSPTEAMRQAAAIRVRPVVMTALAALFALVPMALALEQGSEANAPLGRAVIGGLLAGLLTTLLVVPAFYSLVIRDR